jgi:hypothetical protein
MFAGETRTDITTQTGRVQFFLVQPSQRAKAVSAGAMIGGVAGALVATGVSSGSENPGPVDFVPLDEAAARTKIEELELRLANSE